MLNIVLFGPPGAGKGTQSEKLIKHYNLLHISTGDLFRKHLGEGTKLGQKAKSYMDEGKLVPDQLVVDMVDVKLQENHDASGIIFDGFPRTIPQAEALDKLLQSKDMPIIATVMLEVPDEELINRLLERGKTSGRTDDQDRAKIETRLNVYKQETLPVANYYDKQDKLAKVNGVGAIDDIFQRISSAIDSRKV
ncbi:adenylate kinase [Catalinimonas alkaloidigena]|uniref:adenylate kinase n=1 Tax=Catalinimonas alkaloidigena TaxID=1075417 RepID=UPI002405340A|nr:adenylate kinase [Catalinimonas alkaloidigena]MDF9798485.1 adenylate kinase [Catalinimonas alkaloidigena]